jgi:hypothetical protein
VVAAGAAAAAVVGAVAVAGWVGGGSGAPTPPAQTGAPLDVGPGMQLVGQGEVAVEIPAAWSSPWAGCWDSPPTSTGSREPTTDCARTGGQAGLWMQDLGPDRDRWPFVPGDRSDTVDGTSAVVMATFELTCPGSPCTPTYRGGIVQEDRLQALVVQGPDEEVVRAILSSARAIPSGYVAIPDQPTPAVLEGLGLAVDVRGASDAEDAEEYDADPLPGSVVPVGSEVTLVQTMPSGVEITSAVGTCGPSDGPAVEVAIESDRRLSAYTLLLDGERIVGKHPLILRPDRTNHVVNAVTKAVDADTVTVQVVPTRTGEPIAQVDDVPLALPPGVGPCG